MHFLRIASLSDFDNHPDFRTKLRCLGLGLGYKAWWHFPFCWWKGKVLTCIEEAFTYKFGPQRYTMAFTKLSVFSCSVLPSAPCHRMWIYFVTWGNKINLQSNTFYFQRKLVWQKSIGLKWSLKPTKQL